jgi:hypothetical protein
MVSKRLSVKQKKLLKQHRYILDKLASSNAKKRKIILENAPKELFTVLNLVFKILNDKQVHLTNRQNEQVGKHRKLIRTASGLLKGNHIKRKLLDQKGGALSTILSIVLPALGQLIASIV